MSVNEDRAKDYSADKHPLTLVDDAICRLSSEVQALLFSTQMAKSSERLADLGQLALPSLTMLAFADAEKDKSTFRPAEISKEVAAEDPITYGESGSIRIGSRNGLAVYLRDGKAEWESNDGLNWKLKGTDSNRVWHGEVSIKDGNYVKKNIDSGVSTVGKPDGTISKSIIDAKGQKFETTVDGKGVTVHCVDTGGSWASAEGYNWLNTATGEKRQSTIQLDDYGQYKVSHGAKEISVASSRELALVTARQDRLRGEYGVVFPVPGESVDSFEKKLSLRPPTSQELDCIERVFECNKQMDLRGMRLGFIQASEKTDDELLWGVHSDDPPELLIYPKSNWVIDGWAGLEGTLQHELVHQEQFKDWGDSNWDSNAPAQVQQLMRELGWVYDKNSGNYSLLDKDNKQWQLNEDSGYWDPVVAGKAKPGNESISNGAMRDKAKLKPATDYFDLPWEMHAEGESMYRYDRHQLFEQSRNLYKLMKQYDQREINRKFGTAPDGSPYQMRGVKGTIVFNTTENRLEVDEMERRFSETAAAQSGEFLLGSRHCQNAKATR